jgi:hypothetical protein
MDTINKVVINKLLLDKLIDTTDGYNVDDLIRALTVLLCVIARDNCQDKKLLLYFFADSLDQIYGASAVGKQS